MPIRQPELSRGPRSDTLEILSKDVRFFRRGETLVQFDWIGREDVKAGKSTVRNAAGTPIARLLNTYSLLGLILENANCIKRVMDKNGDDKLQDWEPTHTQRMMILEKGFYPEVRNLITIALAPYVDI